MSPDNGARIAVDQQPVTLTVQNASTSGVRPLSYLLEVAVDAGFTNKVFSRDGISPADGGRTSLQLPAPLAAERSYYWRARAQDGANTGDYSSARTFSVFTPIVIGKPTPVSPINAALTANLRPSFVIGNAPKSGPFGSVTYTVEVSDSDSFANKIATWTVGEAAGQTTATPPGDLTAGKQLFWRTRASESAASTIGPYSDAAVFKTPAVATPPPGGGGGGTHCVFTDRMSPDNVCFMQEAKDQLISEGKNLSGDCGAWSIIDRAVRNMGHNAGYKKKSGTNCNGYSIKSVMFPDGADFLVLISPGTTNGPTWEFFAMSDPTLYAAPR